MPVISLFAARLPVPGSRNRRTVGRGARGEGRGAGGEGGGQEDRTAGETVDEAPAEPAALEDPGRGRPTPGTATTAG
ncbi:hypothetical protein GCM10010282_09730 [Streptomyces roseolus]|nr:hypothetical protein GCM10010282_09730 [Streptomyces roseolus]